MYENDTAKRVRRRKIVLGVLFCFLYIFAILTFVFGAAHYRNRYLTVAEETAAGKTVAENAGQEQKVPGIGDLINATVSLADDLKTILNDIQGGNLEGAKRKTDVVVRNIHTIQASLDRAVNLLGNAFPGIKEQLVNIQNIVSLGEIGASKLLEPAINQLQNYPLSDMRVDGGISTEFLGHYIDFAESVMPDIERCVELANTIDLGIVDRDGKIAAYLDGLTRFMEIYKEDKGVLADIKAMIGAEEDRLYLLAAQNSSEIRAAGGFPGSVGTIRIENGVLKLGGFRSVYHVLSSSVEGKIEVSAAEHYLFGQLSGISAPRDAVNCPDFERVAYIWSLGYEHRQKEPIDGVITMTPGIVQRLLAAIDEEIVLSDGLVLNGENTTKVLQYDLYYKYFGKTENRNAGTISDNLFAEAADQTMQKLMGNLSVTNILNYLSVAEQSFSDRTLMVWMKNEAEQKLVRRFGWNGGLNTDPQKPQAGIYFNCSIASKMGWFLVMDSQLGERTVNTDGSYTYPVTVTLSNSISKEEIQSAGIYILGSGRGTMIGSVYFFAPAGGTVSDFTMSNGGTVVDYMYHDLDLGFVPQLLISPEKTVTVTYNVTTAPGAEEPLTFSQTPTVQAYHKVN